MDNKKMSPALQALSPEERQQLQQKLAKMPPEQRGKFQEKLRTMTPEQLKQFLSRGSGGMSERTEPAQKPTGATADGMTPEQMKKLAGKLTPEQLKQFQRMTPEQRKQAQERAGQMTPEQRKALMEKRANMSPEEMEKMSRNQERMRLMKEKAQSAPQKGAGKPQNASASLKRLLAYLGQRKLLVVGGIVTALLATLFSLLAPQILSSALDRLQVVVDNDGQLHYEKVLILLAILTTVYLLNMVFTMLENQFFSKATQETLYQMRKDVDHKLMKLPFSYFDSVPRGEILSRMTNDIENVGTSLQQSVGQLVAYTLTIVGSLGMMFSICWWLTLLCLLTVPCSIAVSRAIMSRSQTAYREQWKRVGELNATVEETFSGLNVINAFGFEQNALDTFEKTNGELYAVSRKAQNLSAMVNPATTFFNNIAYILICAVGAHNVLNGSMSLGNITALLQYQQKYSTPISHVTSLLNTLQSALASAERVFELLDQPEETQKETTKTLPEPVRGDIRFNHLRFGYAPDKILMHDIDVSVKSGQMVAIVGPTGAGKTTLVNLLMRFYEPNGGGITIDGADISEITRHDLRSVFGMVLQETWLFSGSIRENISYGREQVSEEEMLSAAKSARIDHFVNTFEDGYDTLINEDASNISQGQKQLITIARAMIAHPAILILDEATSSVDTRTEAVIQQAMSNLLKGRTSFVIAHRLSTIRNADLILVMNKGDIVEQGTHESLMKRNGLYAELYQSQFEQKEEASA